MTILVRRIQASDEAMLTHVAPRVFDEPIRPEWLSRYLRRPGHILVLAFDGDTVVGQCAGVVHFHPDKPAELYVDEVGTADDWLRRGIATAMLAELFAWGRELGCEEAWLGTETDNHAALALYRRHAPTEDETMQFFVFRI